MSWTVTITPDGQITLPKELREYLGVRPGDRVTFLVRNGEVLLKPPPRDILEWYGALREQSPEETTNLCEVREAVRRAIAEEIVREGQSA